VLITRDAGRATPLDRFLSDTVPTLPPADGRAVRRPIARGLAAFLAKLHDAGVSHPDPHPGNFLVDLLPCRVPRFVLMDVHAVRFGPPLSWPETRENLTLLNRWFQMRCSRADRARFWRAYLLGRETLDGDADKMIRELETRTAASNARFWARRTARYLAENREYRRVRAGAITGHAVRDLPDDVLRTWLADPDAVFAQPGVRLLKDSRSSTVAVVSVAGRDVVFKQIRVKSWADAAKNLLRPSEARRSWVLGHNLRDRGLPTARPLVLLHRRRHGMPNEGYVAFECVPDAAGLPEAVAAVRDFAARRAWADRLGRMLRDMHDRRVSHRDLKAPNLLLTGISDPRSATPVLIDLVGVRAGRPVPRRTRVRDLARLAASFHGSTVVSRRD
ncbi:MAG: lipopolysaccharide kinase InaA family protein, partial [Fimbriiglobus sp.]